MTFPAPIDYPRSTSWQDFERLVLALFSDMHGARFRRWGSASQRKDGADAWARLPDGKTVVLRCEGRTEHFGKALTRGDIDAALAELAGFPQPVDEVIVLTVGTDDADLAAYAAELSASRKAAGQSSVAVWGWQTISTQIDRHPKVRKAFYGSDVKSSGKKLALLAGGLLIVAGGAGSLFLGKNAIDASNAKPQGATTDVSDIVASLDELGNTYQGCLAVLGRNTYTFSHELIRSCRDPAASQLAALSKKVGKQSPGFDSQTQAELSRILVIFHEDVREAAVATSVAYTFDNEVVGALKAGCGQGAARQSPRDRAAAVKQAGQAAAAAQVRYYFLLRDFIAPELDVAKALLLLHARQNAAGPAREEMAATAARMEQLLVDRAAYAATAMPQPFTLSSLKQTLARTAAPGAQQSGAAEEARWQEVLGHASTESLRGRRNDVEALIKCGAVKEDARALVAGA